MDNILKLYTYNGEGVEITPFPNKEEQVVITDFQYDANRMGSAPSISAKIMHRLCLDNLWTDNVFAEFDGERFFVMNTPSSNKDNEDERYEHEITLLSERELLNHVYFIDAVQGDSTEDQQKSNTTNVQFFGDVNEFVARLNACLQYNKLNFNAVVDEGVTSDAVLVSFEDKYILEALQEIYNLYEIPYYFNGNTIHVGYTDSVVTYPMKYGFDEALLSISKENANYAIINKIKGIGSSDNIPYYYPNKSPKGDIGIQVPETNVSLKDTDIKIFNAEKFAEVNTTDVFTYKKVSDSTAAEIVNTKIMIGETNEWNGHYLPEGSTLDISFTGMEGATKRFMVIVNVKKACNLYLNLSVKATPKNNMLIVTPSYSFDGWTDGTYVEAGTKEFYFNVGIGVASSEIDAKNTVSLSLSYDTSLSKTLEWTLNDKKVSLENYGVRLSDSATVSEGDSFSQKMGVLIPSVENLMPSIYRESLGKEQFYEAKNNTYEDGEGGYYEFENEYSENNQRQGTTEFEDIKPTIVGMTNASGQRMDKFIDFAFDENDNDEVDTDGNYVHPYFFAKLPKYDGENGFNLFDHASESGSMTISMTSGTCGACSFEIGVGEETNKNIVQVDDSGNLKRDEEGNVLWENQAPQDRQNDTENYEVWIALKKDDSTYTNIMPNAYHNLKPSTDDTFVILNINLPDAYIYNAEKKLEQALIKHMWENNREKFNFSIKFSRIFFTEHPEVLDELNENSRVLIEYNGQQHTLYVDNFSYKMSSDSPLPEIEINLVDTLTVGKNSLQTQLDSVKQDILSSIGGSDLLKQGLKYFLRKDVNDTARGEITFNKGLVSDNISSKNFTPGAFGSGYTLKRNTATGRSYMEIDEIYVRLKAYFDTLEIKHLSHVGGRVVISPASMECIRVEIISTDMDALYDYNGDPLYDVESSRLYALKNTTRAVNVYRCYFKQSDDTKEIVNEFAIDDLAQCREFNVKENVSHNVSNQYYWRRVVAVGKDYIDLSADDCDEGSMEPKAGDTIVTIGNKTNAARQHVVFLSSYDEDAPCFKLYSGINSYSMLNKEVTVISPNADKNVFTGKVVIKPGSTGFDNFEDGPDIDAINQDIADANKNAQDAINSANEANSAVGNLNEYIDGAFSDGIISESEAKAIEKYINIVNGEKASSESKYNVLYANPYLMGDAKTNLLNSKISFFGAIDNLISAINTAIQDGKTTVQEKNNVDSKYALYNSAYSDFNKAIEDANESIQNVLKGYSDEAERQAFEAANAASNAQNAANSAQDAVGDLNDYVDGAFSDGIIEKSEAQSIEKYINSVNQTQEEVNATYNVLYNNSYLTGTQKSNLYSAKNAFTSAATNLINTINSAISDGKTTTSEKNDVDSKYDSFNSAYASFSTAIENANKAIQDKVKELAAQEAVESVSSEIESVSNEAKDDLAKKMGYSSFSAMVTAAEKGETIISGGHINTNLIEADAIITSALIASAIKTNRLNVNNKFIVEKDGTFRGVEGTLERMNINGAIRSPFKYDGFTGIIIGGQKKLVTNNIIVTNPSSGNLFSQLPAGEDYDGFSATIINYDSEEGSAVGSVQLQCSYPIWEDGVQKTSTILEAYEGIDIQGFSNGTSFIGWIIKNRFNLSKSGVEMVTITTRANPYDGGTVVGGGTKPIYTNGTIEAIANSGYTFSQWSDGVTGKSRQVTWDKDKTYVANFEKLPDTYYTLTLNVSPSGSGTTSGAGSYKSGTEVKISATPNSGYSFSRWSDGATNTSRYITMNSNKSLTAYFETHTTSSENLFEELHSKEEYDESGYANVNVVGKIMIIGNASSNQENYATGVFSVNKGYISGKIKAGLRYRLTFEHYGGDGKEAFFVGIGDLGNNPTEMQGWDLVYDGLVDSITIGQGKISSPEIFTKEFTAIRTSTASDGLFFAGQVKDTVYIKDFELKEI